MLARLVCALFAGPVLTAGVPAAGRTAASPQLGFEVVGVARSVELSRKDREFLTLTVEITGADAARLRRVQPLRADFSLQAGKAMLPCRWLRGGSVPEDPRRLRFTLGFSLPAPGVRTVTLVANVPRIENEEILEIGLEDVRAGQERSGPGWSLKIVRWAAAPYEPPTLPAKGQFFSKGGAVDARVFRKGGAGAPAPTRVWELALRSMDVALYDPTLDVSGYLLVEDGSPAPLLSASMRRDPSRSVEKAPYRPSVSGEFHFALPSSGRVTGAVIRLHQRPTNLEAQPFRKAGLPVPGVK
jgi:hypothetical protein